MGTVVVAVGCFISVTVAVCNTTPTKSGLRLVRIVWAFVDNHIAVGPRPARVTTTRIGIHTVDTGPVGARI